MAKHTQSEAVANPLLQLFFPPLFDNFLVLYLRSAILNRRSITTAIKCGSALCPCSVLDEARTSVQHLVLFSFFFLILWLFFFLCFYFGLRETVLWQRQSFLVERQLCVQCEMERMFKRLNILVNTIHSAHTSTRMQVEYSPIESIKMFSFCVYCLNAKHTHKSQATIVLLVIFLDWFVLFSIFLSFVFCYFF